MFCVWPISNCNMSSSGSNLCIWCIGLFDKQITFLVHFPPSIFACLNLHQEAPLTCFRVGWFSCTINILTTTRSFWLKRRTNDRIFFVISKTYPNRITIFLVFSEEIYTVMHCISGEYLVYCYSPNILMSIHLV